MISYFLFFLLQPVRKGKRDQIPLCCRCVDESLLHIYTLRLDFFSQYVPFTGLTSSGTVLFVTYFEWDSL